VKKLPSSLTLFGQTITVEHIDNFVSLGDRFGDWDIKNNTIRLQAMGQSIPDEICLQAFFHELTHAMLELGGHSDWSSNETFVELMGQLMYQAEKTRKFS